MKQDFFMFRNGLVHGQSTGVHEHFLDMSKDILLNKPIMINIYYIIKLYY